MARMTIEDYYAAHGNLDADEMRCIELYENSGGMLFLSWLDRDGEIVAVYNFEVVDGTFEEVIRSLSDDLGNWAGFDVVTGDDANMDLDQCEMIAQYDGQAVTVTGTPGLAGERLLGI